jgi:hypothetical protein
MYGCYALGGRRVYERSSFYLCAWYVSPITLSVCLEIQFESSSTSVCAGFMLARVQRGLFIILILRVCHDNFCKLSDEIFTNV